MHTGAARAPTAADPECQRLEHAIAANREECRELAEQRRQYEYQLEVLKERRAQLQQKETQLASKQVELVQELASRRNDGLALAKLPEHILSHILLTCSAPHHDLLLFVSRCARVCRTWRLALMGSIAYGAGLSNLQPHEDGHMTLDDLLCRFGRRTRRLDLRSRVLKMVRTALRDAATAKEDYNRGRLTLSHSLAHSNYSQLVNTLLYRVLHTALLAMPAPISLRCIELARLTPETLDFLAPVMPWSKLKDVNVSHSTLGDAGLKALACLLPKFLEHLDVSDTNCCDEGIKDLAAALPGLPRISSLCCNRNASVGVDGWRILFMVLPELPGLASLQASGCRLSSTAVQVLAQALPRCLSLEILFLNDNNLDDTSKNALRVGWTTSVDGRQRDDHPDLLWIDDDVPVVAVDDSDD